MLPKNAGRPRIGIIGGGQLGRMFIENAARYPVDVVILEDDPHSPAAQLTPHFIQGQLKDEKAIRALAAACDVVTYEIEHINADALVSLQNEGHLIIPFPQALKIIQDKGAQKQFYQDNDIPTSPFRLVNQPEGWLAAMESLGGEKFAVKSRKGGYDGKGVLLTDIHAVKNTDIAQTFQGGVMIEQFIPCRKEIAVLVAIGQNGEKAVYPAVDMEFHPLSNLVTYLFTPADIDSTTEASAQEIALRTVSALKSPGLFAVEFFLDYDGRLWVNEMAPRPHNSAHHTIEACETSQFDQLLRVVMGWPLGSTRFHKAGVMINLTGPEDGTGSYRLAGMEEALATEGFHVHMYGKARSKPHRKLGHLTVTDTNIETAKAKANSIREQVRVKIL